MHPRWIIPQWAVPGNVRALITTRPGGFSLGPWAAADGSGGMNLGWSGDDPVAVEHNRARLRAALPQDPCWLHQVHGTEVVDASLAGQLAQADAAFSTQSNVVCCVLIADCLPVLLADAHGRGVALAHAGWRGLAGGVIQKTVVALRRARCSDTMGALSQLPDKQSKVIERAVSTGSASPKVDGEWAWRGRAFGSWSGAR